MDDQPDGECSDASLVSRRLSARTSCNPKDKTTVSAWMLISTFKVALNPTSSAKLDNSQD
jgi:hypothetical protein